MSQPYVRGEQETLSMLHAGPIRTTAHLAAPAAEPVDKVSRWRLVRLVSEGELARVYQATSADAHAEATPAYAVKMLRPEWEHHPAALEMFAREATLGRTVASRHLAPVLASQLRESPRYLVMPWLPGYTLAELLRPGKRLAPPVALWFVRQAAEGLQALHAAGWTHGDIKPSNMLVAPEGHLTLIDPAFARPVAGGAVVDRLLVGTPHYLAPEWFGSKPRTDIRSDMYSLGVTLYEALAGRRPYDRCNLTELATAHRQAAPQPLRDHAPHVSAELAQLVHRMLAKQPIRRPQTPAELIGELVRFEIATFADR